MAAASVMVLPNLNALLSLHLQLLPTPLSPMTTPEQCLPSCPLIHLYVPRTENSATHTPTPTVNAMDATIEAQTNLAADFDFEGDFFSYCDNIIDEANDLCY